MNIRVDLTTPITNGTEVVFRSPVDCSQITGLVVYYNDNPMEFAFADAHGNNVGDIDHLFAENAVVKVILDVTHSMAFVQNADTNAYIERTFVKTVNGVSPDGNGNVDVDGGVKSVNGVTPDANGNVTVQTGGGGTGIAQPLKFKILDYIKNQWVTDETYDGTEEVEIPLIQEFMDILEGGPFTIHSAHGPCHFDGTLKLDSIIDSPTYTFYDAYGYGIQANGRTTVYIADTYSNTQYRIAYPKTWPVGEVEVVTAPLVSEGGAGGADGITPHIGDNGNWWLGETDTGVSATVDTAEVEGYATAAEASAARAEEAADRAEAAGGGTGGGGEMRLVKSITLEQNVTQFNLTADDDGNQFNLSDAFIEIRNPEHSNAAYSSYIQVDGENGATTNQVSLSLNLGESKKNVWIALDRFCDKLRFTYTNGKVSTKDDYVRGHGSLFDISKIKKIMLKCDGAGFVAGTTLKLYTRG